MTKSKQSNMRPYIYYAAINSRHYTPCGDIGSPVDAAFVAGGVDPSAAVVGLLSAVAESDGTWDKVHTYQML